MARYQVRYSIIVAYRAVHKERCRQWQGHNTTKDTREAEFVKFRLSSALTYSIVSVQYVPHYVSVQAEYGFHVLTDTVCKEFGQGNHQGGLMDGTERFVYCLLII